MHRNYLHIVSRDDDIEDILDLEFTRLGARAPIQDVSFKHSSKFETAIRRLKEAPPSIVILDTGWADGDKSAGDILRELRDNNICSPVLLIVRRQSLADLQSVVGMACSASNISSWLWTSAPPDLAALFSPLLGRSVQSEKSRLRATVHIADQCIYWDIEKDGIPIFKDITSPLANPHSLEDDTKCSFKLDDCVRSPDIVWNLLTSRGNSLWRKLLEPLGNTLLEPNEHFNLELRFVIERESVDRLFGLPLELMNGNQGWKSFICRRAELARRVSVTESHNPNPRNAKEKPLMLFVHAGDVIGQLEVVTEGRRTKEQFRNLKSEVDKELVELKKRLEGKCEIEPLLPGADSSLRDLVRKRLQDPVLQAPDVVHFSGHARTISQPQGRGEQTFLVLPSSSRRLADGLSVEVLSSWLPPATRLVTLSACQGVSAHTTEALHAKRGVSVLGFRWEVEATSATQFMARFYERHLVEGASLARSYRDACFENSTDADFTWAAAMLLHHD